MPQYICHHIRSVMWAVSVLAALALSSADRGLIDAVIPVASKDATIVRCVHLDPGNSGNPDVEPCWVTWISGFENRVPFLGLVVPLTPFRCASIGSHFGTCCISA